MTHPKRRFLETMLDGNKRAHLHVDPSDKGVTLPAHLTGELGVKLLLTRDPALTTPIKDLMLSDGGVSATLSFRGVQTWCFVPWIAVVAITNAAGTPVWPDALVVYGDPSGPTTSPARWFVAIALAFVARLVR